MNKTIIALIRINKFAYRDICFGDIGITHVFSCINICLVRGRCLNTRPIGRVLKRLLRDPAIVNAMKQTCVIVILAYLPNSNQIRSENAVKTLQYPFPYTEFL